MTIVVHGTWQPLPSRRGFFLWGEAAPEEARPHAGGRRGVRAHPFQYPRAKLDADVFRALGEEPYATETAKADVVLLLPSAGGRPSPSPELLRAGEMAPAPEELTPWRISGLTLSPLTALGWLSGLPTGWNGLPAGIRLGADVRYWATAAHLALELLARQRFLPGVDLRRRSGEASARWKPLLEEERDRFERLAAVMPPVCRAHLGEGEGVEPERLLEGFLEAVIDGFVRQAAARLRLRPRFLDTVGSRLAAALLSPEGALDENKEILGHLRADLEHWRQQLEQDGESPFRIAFRLEPPEPNGKDRDPGHGRSGEEDWVLRFFLQAVDDPSLLVPLSGIWRHSGSSWRYLHRRMDQPQERVLEGLARASELFPPIEESLKESRPEACRLDLRQAYSFLTEAAFLLRESGFGVLVPSWWGKQESSLGLKLRVHPTRDPGRIASGIGLDAIVGFDWQVALGEENLDREEFLRLVELKRPLVRVRGQWVELRGDQIEEALSVLRSRPARAELALREVLPLRLGRRSARGLPIAGIEAEGWVEELLAKLAGTETVPELAPPADFQGVLRPYQVRGLSWLAFLARWGLGACLADDMGLGKTIQLLALLLHLKSRGELEAPFLLICPTSVVSNWRKEAERFAPSLQVLIHHGLGRHEGEDFIRESARHDLVVSTFSLVHRDLERLLSVGWGGIVLDEAQNIKNPAAKQTQALRLLRAPIRIALTGTPVENRLSELWSIMEFLNPGYLGSPVAFKRRYGVPIERYRDEAATEELRALVRPFILRRVKTDPTVIRDLPEKNEMKVYCSLTREQATLYEAVVRESMRRIEGAEGIERKGEVLAALTRLKQVCNHPAHYLGDGSRLDGRSGKLTRLSEMMEEVLAEGDHALVFTQFAAMGRLLQSHLRDTLSVEVLFLHGGVPARQREELIARFQEDPAGPPLFVLSLKAGGFGLNLTRARHVFHFDRWWNPAVEDQATDRVFRIGQTRTVAVHKFICAGTVEERIDELIEQKKELAGLVVGAGESWLTELSTEDLRDLFALRGEAIED